MIRKAAKALLATTSALVLSVQAAFAFDPANMTEQERTAFDAAVRSYLLENPEVIVEAINLMEQRNAEQQAAADDELVAAYSDELFNDNHSWVTGNLDGDIVLVEFMDYRCGYCRRAVPEVNSLLEDDGNIKLIIKEFPILGEASVISSRFAIATLQVAGDDAYGLVHDALLEMNGEINGVTLRRLGEGLGLDVDAIMDHMDSDEVTAVIVTNRQLAQALKINGTPTFILVDEMLRGYLPADQMAEIIAEKRS
ncbi:DsbA family protein [Phaeobacter sp. 22II1-1F12B]|uniref:DsbA family protein n=1 Tax=Phaeobacter sp. 22II1-1F12B TaxID=1317111 RepID=UPI000B522070|nr:DsbA family protein [Phaeobacter sp. 22II1-1F12B]OWU81342.1 DSBA oxidoreductase [Phaeobacter sp. 22II1-1F12B]